MNGIIIWQKTLTLADDYVDEQGFFFRASVAGNIKYCAKDNADAEALTEAFDASVKFDNPVFCRKVFKTGTTATVVIGKSE